MRRMTQMGIMTAATALIGLDSSAMATSSICAIDAGYDDAGGGFSPDKATRGDGTMFDHGFDDSGAPAQEMQKGGEDENDSLGNNAMGGGSGGVDLGKTGAIDDKFAAGDDSGVAGTSQMQQQMDLGDPEPGADDDLAEAGQAVAAEAPGADADDKPADGEQQGD